MEVLEHDEVTTALRYHAEPQEYVGIPAGVYPYRSLMTENQDVDVAQWLRFR